jgi:5-carboxymethyl-2-hydroxymuconate isomerase
MPHLVLQYSANIDPPPEVQELFGELHRTISELTGVDVAKFKSRAIGCDNFLVGDGSPANGFAHLDVRLLGGRPIELKRQVADAALAILQTHFARAARALDLQITVDLLDVEADTYRKFAGQGGTG